MTHTTEEAKTKGHEPSQGADGAWTMAALIAREAELSNAISEASGWGAAVGAMSEELQGIQRQIAALAAPRADSAERTAGETDRAIVSALYSIDFVREAESYEFRPDEGCHTPTEFEKTLLIDFANGLMGRAHEVIRPLVAPSSPGVPDSLWALSEALESTKAAADDLASVCIEEGDNKAAGALQFISGFISDQVAAISAHPAGQSTGQGAKTKIPADREAVIALAIHLAREGDTSLFEKIKAELLAPTYPVQVLSGAEDAVASAIEQRWDGLIGPAYEGDWIGWKRRDFCREFAKAAIAARPAAPEAQGAWKPTHSTDPNFWPEHDKPKYWLPAYKDFSRLDRDIDSFVHSLLGSGSPSSVNGQIKSRLSRELANFFAARLPAPPATSDQESA